MNIRYGSILLAIFIFAFINKPALSELSQEQLELEQYAAKLDRINFLPTLLPLIIDNRDVIGLSDEQVKTLLAWRKQNRAGVIATMNEVVRKRVAIMEAALNPNVSAARIEQMQSEIFRLQRKVLDYKLSCRELVIHTLDNDNWDGFMLVLAEKNIAVPLPTVTTARE